MPKWNLTGTIILMLVVLLSVGFFASKVTVSDTFMSQAVTGTEAVRQIDTSDYVHQPISLLALFFDNVKSFFGDAFSFIFSLGG